MLIGVMLPGMSDARRSGQTPRAIADLADELRARLYGFVRGRRAPVTREEAAQAVGISRKLAAWHLEKMVEHGLLEASYGRERGRRRGRSARMYSSSPVELTVSIPQRRYDLAAEVLMDALGA
jgi:predicted ArsR family transcriptional regulator